MTNRLKGCTVVFDADIREDDAESILQAIAHVVHVGQVIPSVTTTDDHLARARVRLDFAEEFVALINSLRGLEG